MMKQPLRAKQGEIEFRRKLYEQEILGLERFVDEPTDKITEIIRNRALETYNQIKALQDGDICISPYIEIGAERCQRSLIMENELHCHGAAIDISFYSLKSCDYYKRVFQQDSTPARICCDANNLPLVSDSVPFIFCYETLHHFPDPQPVIQEVHRVLAPGGCFFFATEPFEKKMHVSLYDAGKKYSKENLAKNWPREIFDFFFGKKSCNEIEHGVIENEQMSLDTWKQAVSVFEKRSVVTRTWSIEIDLFDKRSYSKRLLRYLLGGLVSGSCFKRGTFTDTGKRIEELLACPDCLENRTQAKLVQEKDVFVCEFCDARYRSIDGVIFLLSNETLQKLYPDIAGLTH